MNANYHTDLSEADVLEEAKEAISLFPERYDHFCQVFETLIEEGK